MIITRIPISADRLEAIHSRLCAMPGGIWEIDTDEDGYKFIRFGNMGRDSTLLGGDSTLMSDAQLDFILHARDDISALLLEVARLQAILSSNFSDAAEDQEEP